MNLILIIIIVSTVVLVLFAVIVALLNRGKQLKCPDCEQTFNAPVMEQKLIGGGWTFPYMGTIRCPKCGKSRARRDYNKIEQQTKKE